MLDELAVLPKIPGLSEALNFLPSRGGCFLLGFQSYGQIDDLYTPKYREALVSSAGTHIFFSVGGSAPAEEAAKIIGSAEYLENRQTLSIGVADSRDGGSSMDQISNRLVITADEIRELQPLNAVLKILSFPAAKIKVDYVPYQTISELEPDPTWEMEAWLESAGPVKVVKAEKGEIEEAEIVEPAPAAAAAELPTAVNNNIHLYD